jgi:signal transduction histidine kinase
MAPPCLDELLGTVAHELRSPLATVVSGVSMIRSECELGPFARRALAIMEHQSRQAMQLVDDLFDLCAGGLGKLSLRKETVAVGEVVARAAEKASPLLAARRHRLTVSLPPGPLSLEADPLRLDQVLANLLSNAAKFTDPGGDIRLSAGAEAGQAVLRVRDNGRGIAPELLPRVFEPFWQAPGPGHKGGLGLGLALVKSLVELHGGSVAAPRRGRGRMKTYHGWQELGPARTPTERPGGAMRERNGAERSHLPRRPSHLPTWRRGGGRLFRPKRLSIRNLRRRW